MTSFGKETSNIQSLINAGLAAHKSGDVEQALEQYERILPLLSGSVFATISSNAGAICMQLGDYDRAHKHFFKAVESSPDNAQGHFNLAVLLTTKLGKHARAIKSCKTALNLDPKMIKAYHLMGNILQTIGRPDEANQYFIQADELSNDSYASTQDHHDKLKGNSWGHLPIASAKIGQTLTVEIDDHEFSLVCISERPRVFRVSGLLTEAECDELLEHTKKNGVFEKSFVTGGGSSYDKVQDASPLTHLSGDSAAALSASDPYRLSETAWLPLNPLLRTLQNRISQLTQLPLPYIQHNSEDLQVVKYQTRGRFKAHQDSSEFHSRLLTALVYLTHAPSVGGGTWFPFAGRERPCELSVEDAIAIALEEDLAMQSIEREDVDEVDKEEVEVQVMDSTRRQQDSKKRRSGLVVSPERGSAVLFFNHLPDGSIDPAAVHAGLTVGPNENGAGTEGEEKWIANYWIGQNLESLSEFLGGKANIG